MKEEVEYLPPQYVFLKPIIQDSTTVNKTSYISPVNQSQVSEYISTPQPNINQNKETIISEYISTPQPKTNQNQETIISEYRSTSQSKINQNQGSIISEYNASPQPNLSNNSQTLNVEPIITHPMSNSKIINLPNINRSNISQTSMSQQIRNSNSSHPLDTEEPINQSIISQPKMTQSIIINKSNIKNSITSNNQQSTAPINNKSLMGKIPGVLPVYRLIKQGSGINPTEEQGIVFCAMKVYQEEILPLSNNTARFIQRKIGGDWLVIVYEQGKPVDFNMTCIEGIDYMYFTLDTMAFQVCRLR